MSPLLFLVRLNESCVLETHHYDTACRRYATCLRLFGRRAVVELVGIPFPYKAVAPAKPAC